MKRRWFIYLAVGVLFGVFDFFSQNILEFFLPNLHLSTHSLILGQIIGLTLSYGLWLVPIVPIILYEAKISHSRILAGLSNSFTWCISVLSYYVTYVVQQLSSPSGDLHISNPFFWSNLQSYASTTLEWIIFAAISGFVFGFLVSLIYLFFSRN